MRGCPSGLGGRLVTKSDLILDIGKVLKDRTQGGEAKHQKIRAGRGRGDGVLMEESSKGAP